MKRSALLAAAALGIILAAAYVVRVRNGPPDAEFNPDIPPSVFLPDDPEARQSAVCDFSVGEGRATFSKTWGKPFQPCFAGDGWTHPSESGIRAYGPRSWIDVFAVNRRPDLLLLTVRGVPHRKSDRRQSVKVFVNGVHVGTRDVPFEWTTLGLELPPGVVRRGTNRVEFSFAYRARQRPVKGKKGDFRHFAADLRDITLIEHAGPAPSDDKLPAIVQRAKRSSGPRPAVLDRRTGRFHITERGTLILPISPPADSTRLALELNAPAGIDTRSLPANLTIRVVESGETWSPKLPAWRKRHDGRGLQSKGTIPAASCAGARCVVTLDLAPKPDGKTIEIVPLEALGDPTTPPRSESTVDFTRSPSALPDVVVIILDAARFDHFSFAGYERETTPNIDRLAAESLVFTNVFALAPYTMCSVPTIVSGLSFLEHGVTQRGRALAGGVTTLAETLREAGYFTIAYSTNPNNSRSTGTDQGYDEFHELWNEVPRSDVADAGVTTQTVLERMATMDDSQPLHLQVHYMPPHAPYDPAPEFDIFTDPAYSGPCDGSNLTIKNLSAGRQSPENGCLEHVIALYDGGLRAADAAVGQLVDALRRRERWRDTIVLVTSDHGEAFLEHGHTGHNGTVYDEMLHVPFVLRLPRGPDLSRFDTGRLATLADIVPTLLAAASLRETTPVSGTNLLNAPPLVDGIDNRYFVARTTGSTPNYGLRTTHWKMILSGSGQGALFNVEKDPGETDNVAFTDRATYFAIGDLLTRRLARPSESVFSESAVPDSDREMLEALGYVVDTPDGRTQPN